MDLPSTSNAIEALRAVNIKPIYEELLNSWSPIFATIVHLLFPLTRLLHRKCYRPAACSLLSDVIDADQADEGMLVAHGVCEELDALKHSYHGLPSLLTEIVRREVARIPSELCYGLSSQLWTMMYMPQVMVSGSKQACSGMFCLVVI